jgi:hypothetical protein
MQGPNQKHSPDKAAENALSRRRPTKTPLRNCTKQPTSVSLVVPPEFHDALTSFWRRGPRDTRGCEDSAHLSKDRGIGQPTADGQD